MIEKYDIPYTQVEQSLMDWATEALELRHGAGGDPKGKLSEVDIRLGQAAVLDMLSRVRQRSDRVDELLAMALQARGRFRRARDEAEFSAELAYDEATHGNKLRRTFDSFETKDERKAEASLASLNEKRAAHEAKRLVGIAEEVYALIDQVHWQLDAIRRDLRASLHSLQFESSLER